MYLYRCVHSVSLTEHSITIQVGDKRCGLLALDKLLTNQGRHSAAAPPIAPTSLHRYIYRPNPAMNSSIGSFRVNSTNASSMTTSEFDEIFKT